METTKSDQPGQTPTNPYEEGWAEGLLGTDHRACPYDKMTKEWDEWQNGRATVLTLLTD